MLLHHMLHIETDRSRAGLALGMAWSKRERLFGRRLRADLAKPFGVQVSAARCAAARPKTTMSRSGS